MPPNFPWARFLGDKDTDVPARNLRPGSATPAPAFPGRHAALASTRGGAPAMLRQNAGLDHAGRPVRAASGTRVAYVRVALLDHRGGTDGGRLREPS